MRSAALLILSGVLFACGSQNGSSRPCTTCPDVSGTYVETVESALASQSTCGELLSNGGTDSVSVTQPDGGSELHIQSGFGGHELVATLNEDKSISTSDVVAVDLDGTPGSVSLSGQFKVGTARRFDGSWQFTLPSQACVVNNKTATASLSVKTVWTIRQ